MTIICVNDGIMAVDSQVTCGDIITDTINKIVRLSDGAYFCSAGNYVDSLLFKTWYEEGKDPFSVRKPVVHENFVAVVMGPNFILNCYSDLNLFPVIGKYNAWGCGWEMALGAMDMGADASEAVEVVCKRDVSCGYPVRCISQSDIRDGLDKNGYNIIEEY